MDRNPALGFGSESEIQAAGEAADQFAQNFPVHWVKSGGPHFSVKCSNA